MLQARLARLAGRDADMTDEAKDEGQIFLSEKLIQQWKVEYVSLFGERNQLSEQLKEVQSKQNVVTAKIQEIGNKLRSATAFSPPLAEWMIEQEVESAENIPLTTAILKALLRLHQNQAMNRNNLQVLVPQLGYPAQKLQANPNYIYIAIKRLLERKPPLIREHPPGHYMLPPEGRAEAMK
jgi:hypothetical protein